MDVKPTLDQINPVIRDLGESLAFTCPGWTSASDQASVGIGFA